MKKMKKRYNFLNVDLESISDEESFERVKEYINTGRYHYQISVNVAKLVYAQKDEKLLKCINSADIINADGMPIKIICDILSKKKTTRMGGFDYIDGLAKLFPDFKYYFIGAKQDVVEKVVNIYREKHNLNIVGWRNGYFKKNELDLIIKDINKKQTDVLYLGIGTPEKEYLLYDLKNVLKCKFAVGVGGAFDIIAGKTKRAPLWMQKIGMEWLFRIIQEPKRMWKRYLITNTLFFKYLLKEKFSKRSK